MLRTGGTAQTLGCVVKAPSTLGTFLRSFRWGHVRQFGSGSAASCWHGPGRLGPDPATRHSPSTWIRRSARHTVWPRRGRATTATRARRGYHPLLAVAAGTGDVLMARLRKGRANTVRGAAHFLREDGGAGTLRLAPGAQLTVRADSGFYTHAIVAVLPQDGCALLHHHPPAVLACAVSSRPYPSTDWTPIPYWMDGAADVAESTYTPLPG